MFFRMPCWNCGKPLRTSDEDIGKKARCPYCGTVGEIRRPEIAMVDSAVAADTTDRQVPFKTSGPDVPEKREGGQSRGTNVSLSLSALLGLAVTTVFYLVFVIMPDNPVRRIFLERGFIPYVITFLTYWAGAMLVFKYLKISTQRSALLFDVLPVEVAEEIRPDTVDAFRSNILSLPIDPEKSFLIGRVLRALDHYRVHPTRESVSTLLTNQSEIEANIVESSYSMVKVMVWAIPILGFIGTVMGVGLAVGSFSGVVEEAANFAAAKPGLAKVTSGLGIAFDTTLLALVMSLIVMFPTSALQKTEEDLLSMVDQYCNENILRRLSSLGHDAGKSGENIAGNVDRIFTKRISELQEWAKNLENTSNKLTENVADAWQQVSRSIEQLHREETTAASDSCEKMVGSVADLHSRLADAGENVADLNRSQERLVELNGQLLVNLETMSDDGDLKETLLSIERQLGRNSEVMELLGKQMSSKPRGKVKRSWFFSKKDGEAREDA